MLIIDPWLDDGSSPSPISLSLELAYRLLGLALIWVHVKAENRRGPAIWHYTTGTSKRIAATTKMRTEHSRDRTWGMPLSYRPAVFSGWRLCSQLDLPVLVSLALRLLDLHCSPQPFAVFKPHLNLRFGHLQAGTGSQEGLQNERPKVIFSSSFLIPSHR